MSITAAMPTAKERPRRTRTKRVSSLPAIKLSQLLPSQIDLRDPAKAVLVCVDCGTWVPITGMQSGKVQKLVPHHTGKAYVDAAIRCRGSNRRIEFDMTIPEWCQALADAVKEAAVRRSTNVLRKPKVAPAPAISQIATQKQTPADDEPGDGRSMWLLREMGWAATESYARETDTRRAQLPDGDAPLGAPPVPLTTLHPKRPTR